MLCLASAVRQRPAFILSLEGYMRAWIAPSTRDYSNPCNAVPPSRGSSSRSVRFKPYVPPCPLDHDYKNMTLKRPMSPHLTIYVSTQPAMTSIAQRATGIIVTFYACAMCFGTLFLPNGVECYVGMIQSLDMGRMSTFIIKLLIGVPFTFHYFNGIRFCLWNANRCLDLKDVFDTARKSWIATGVLTLLFALL